MPFDERIPHRAKLEVVLPRHKNDPGGCEGGDGDQSDGDIHEKLKTAQEMSAELESETECGAPAEGNTFAL